jgi:hypothetical protein
MVTRIFYDAVRQDGEGAPVNVKKALARGVPFVEKTPPHGRPLAIVGGGVSVLKCIGELQNWPGDIWAVNAMSKVLKNYDIECTAVTVDPHVDQWKQFDGEGDALLATCCAPKLFDMYEGRCRAFNMVDDAEDGLLAKGGGTSASSIHLVAFELGYTEISYFGCESSYTYKTHVYDYEDPGPYVTIEAGGEEYNTKPYLEMQACFLSSVMREFPSVFKNRSGGLLGAMIKHPDTWTIVNCADELKPYLTEFERAA